MRLQLEVLNFLNAALVLYARTLDDLPACAPLVAAVADLAASSQHDAGGMPSVVEGAERSRLPAARASCSSMSTAW